MGNSPGIPDGKFERENGTRSEGALNGDGAASGFSKARDNGEPHASVSARGEEGFKDAGFDGGVDANACVCDGDDDVFGCVLRLEGDAVFFALALGYGLCSIDEEIEDVLPELAGSKREGGEVWADVGFKARGGFDAGFSVRDGLLEFARDIEARRRDGVVFVGCVLSNASHAVSDVAHAGDIELIGNALQASGGGSAVDAFYFGTFAAVL